MLRYPWKVSLHGGHSGQFCEHAEGSLRATLDAAAAAGFAAYGVSEHAPRSEARFLYGSERSKGYTVARLEREFAAYAAESARLQREFRGRLAVLRGFESECVPTASYAEEMRALRRRHAFDYMVGSVHHVGEISIDETPELYRKAAAACGGLEPMLERYYGQVRDMIEALQPEVVAHLDLPRLHAHGAVGLPTPRVRRAAAGALAAARQAGCILDLNTAAWRKGLAAPYPAPWLARLAAEAGLPFCFGDDSHRPTDVGAGLERARRYLLSLDIQSVTALEPAERGVRRREIPLKPESTAA